MSGYMQHNTVQTVRGFLASLDVHPSTYASSQEVIDALIESVQLRQHDARTRQAFAALVDALHANACASPDRLPSLDCETRDPQALARELTRLLDGRPQTDCHGRAKISAVALAAATLLMGATVGMGCSTGGYEPGDPRCANDLSLGNFSAMVWNSDLRAGLVDDAEEEYMALPVHEQKEVVEDLCGLSADEIADYILDNFALDDEPEDDNWDDYSDDDCGYKGVTF